MQRIIKAHQLTSPPAPWQPGLPEAAGPPREAPTSPSSPAEDSPAPPQLSDQPDPQAVREAARQQGLAQGIRAAEESYRATIARLDSLSAALQQERAEFFSRVEPELVRLSISIAEKVIQRELELNPDIVLELIRSAMKRLRERETLRVSVNPRDLDQVKQARDDLISAVDGVRKLEIIEDRRVGPGGCLIESPNGSLDSRIDTQIDEITRALTDVAPDGVGQECVSCPDQPPADRSTPSSEEPDGLRSLPGSD